MKYLAIVLIGIGLVMIFITGFNFVTKKKIVDLGSVEISKEENHPVDWSPIIGAVLLVSGVVVYVTNRNKK